MMKRRQRILWISLAFIMGFAAGSTVAVLKGRENLDRPRITPTNPSQLAAPPLSIEDTEKMEDLKQELRQNPGDQESWLRLGNLYAINGQIQLALDAFRHYLALKPGDQKGWRELGNLLERSGDLEGAAEAFKKATPLDPGRGEQGAVEKERFGSHD
jgi:tetratricopeptide (TPR) repeat protein